MLSIITIRSNSNHCVSVFRCISHTSSRTSSSENVSIYGIPITLLESFALNDAEEHVFVARARDPTLHHHMRDRAVHVLQNASRVRND